MRPVVQTLYVITAVGATVLAGCTSADTKNDYLDAVAEVRANAADTFNQVVTSTPGDNKAMVEQLEAGEAALDDGITELDSLDVPEEAETRHPEFVADLGELRDLFASSAEKAQNAEGTEVFAVAENLASKGGVIGAQLDEAVTRIRRDLNDD